MKITKEISNLETIEYIHPFFSVSENKLSVSTDKETVTEAVEEFKNLFTLGTAECDIFEDYVENQKPKTVEDVLNLVIDTFLEVSEEY